MGLDTAIIALVYLLVILITVLRLRKGRSC